MNPTIVAPPSFHIECTGSYEHYEKISDLWEKKWKAPCSKGTYPFMDGKSEDFEPIFAKLIEMSGDDIEFLNDPDAMTEPFIPVAQELMKRAAKAEASQDTISARNLYLRAGAVLRISRFPIVRSEKSALAWKMNKEAYSKAGPYLNPPNREVSIPFTHADPSAGDAMTDIPAYLRIPNTAAPSQGWPVLLFICGLDSYRTDNTARIQAHLNTGFAVLAFEIPGTGDCPASRQDPTSPDRLLSSIVSWVHTRAGIYNFNIHKVCARGISTGSYYTIRVAHTHNTSLLAAAAQGAGAHYMFHPNWVSRMSHMEYPYQLAEAIACKFGYGTGDVESFLASKPMDKYSLLKDEIMGKESCRMLIINGMEDSVFPIEDSVLVAMAGRNKELLVRANLGHMGNPGGEEIVVKWLANAIRQGQ